MDNSTAVAQTELPPQQFDGIPKMGAKSKPADAKPLGEVKAEVRSKSNLTSLFKVGIGIGIIVILAGGLLAYQKLKPKKVASVEPVKQAALPYFSQKNEEVKGGNIDDKKEALLKKDKEESDRIAAITGASAVSAAPATSAESVGSAGQGSSTSSGQQSCAGDNCPLSPMQRKLAGEVSIVLPAAQQNSAQIFHVPNGAVSGNNGLPADYPKMPDVNSIVQKMNLSSGAGAQGLNQSGNGGPSLASQLKPTLLEARYAGKLSDLNYLLKRGTSIPCSLKTGIDTTLAGLAICTATNDVYSANGKLLLIARGAVIHGEQQSSLKLGQARVFLLWTRIDNPDGITAELDSPAADAMGYNGIPGFVDEHFGARFGAAMLISVIKDATSFELSNLSRNNNATAGQQFTPTNTASAGSSMAESVLKSTMNIPPTLVVKPSTLVNVLVARDISFEKVYRVMK